jgi:hypothetical protein
MDSISPLSFPASCSSLLSKSFLGRQLWKSGT